MALTDQPDIGVNAVRVALPPPALQWIPPRQFEAFVVVGCDAPCRVVAAFVHGRLYVLRVVDSTCCSFRITLVIIVEEGVEVVLSCVATVGSLVRRESTCYEWEE